MLDVACCLIVQQMGVPEDEARWFFQQFIIGLDYCHRMGIANRDIKVGTVDVGSDDIVQWIASCRGVHSSRVPQPSPGLAAGESSSSPAGVRCNAGRTDLPGRGLHCWR